MSRDERSDALTASDRSEVRVGAINANDKHRVTRRSKPSMPRALAVITRDKKPEIRYRGRTDLAYLALLMRNHPGLFMAVLTGSVTGIVMIDADGARGIGNLQRLERKHGRLPATWIERTPRGGLHYWYAIPPGITIRNSASKIAQWVDVRGEGGFGNCWPSPGYVLIRRWFGPLPYLPGPWADMLQAPRTVNRAQTGAEGTGARHNLGGIVQTLAGAQDGTRNATLFWCAARIFELPQKKQRNALRMIRQEALYLGLPEDEVERTIANARRTA